MKQHFKYTTYLEVESKYLLVRRVPSKLTLKAKSTRIQFRNQEEAVNYLNELRCKFEKNRYKIIDQDRLSFRVYHQSPLIMGLQISRNMKAGNVVKVVGA